MERADRPVPGREPRPRLIGLGFAGGLMSGFKAVVLWVPEPRRALANPAIMSFGALGILVATVPTELAVQAGILLSGAVADWFVRRGVDLLSVMLGFLALFLVSELAIVLQWTSINLLMWVVFGMTG